ncbi:ASCH domain-containing protein [Candidatus Sumerlaeota bacterium]|nr:ASCH domain-containing protein [Candidatus Sumerlaeota bacterium]
MKVISLWEPWASLVAMGVKMHETRHWKTNYRGPLVIHAAKRKADRASLLFFSRIPRTATVAALFDRELAYGKAVCLVDLVDCIPTENVSPHVIEKEGYFGNYSKGRFAWRFINLREFRDPFPMVGRQALFSAPDDLREYIARGEFK